MFAWLSLYACWQLPEEGRKRRLWEMQEHEESCLAARDAVVRQDLVALRRAGADIALPDPVPMLPEDARPLLESVRQGGRTLEAAGDLASGAGVLLDITTRCAACHQHLGAGEPAPFGESPLDELWIALLFQSEARWSAGIGRLAVSPNSRPLTEAASWEARRSAMASFLLGGGQ